MSASIARLSTAAVTFRYPQHGRGLAPTTLAVEAGQRLLVSGASGCGKSTLARCLAGLIPHLYHGALGGRVDLDGLETAGTPLWQLAEHAGMVLQNPATQMLAATVEEEIVFGLENLGLAPEEVRRRVEETLAHFGLEPLRARRPYLLSGGEQQKVALAAIMARRPPVLVLDEPLSMLDSTAALALVGDLCGPALAETAIVVCEHRAEYLAGIPGLCRLEMAGPGGGAEERPAPPFEDTAAPFALHVEGLTVRLGARAVLDGLSFAARGGEVVAVVGRNGVGKTTLLRALAGLARFQGRIAVGGEFPELGMVLQNAELQLFNPTVRQEILYRLPRPDMGLYAWLRDILGLAPYEETPPLLLSDGEKKRVALATVLMRRPRHGVLLDEPALGQDGAHKAMLVRLARALAAAGKLVVLTTHDLTLAVRADRLLLLGADGFVADGPPAEVLRDPRPWARIGLQVPPWLEIPPRGGR